MTHLPFSTESDGHPKPNEPHLSVLFVAGKKSLGANISPRPPAFLNNASESVGVGDAKV